MDAYEYLTAARDLIASPGRWCAGMLAADDRGHDLGGEGALGEAARYCAVGALIHVTGRRDWQDADGLLGCGQQGLAWALASTARDMHPWLSGAMDILGAVNNSLGHDAVLAVLDEARARCRSSCLRDLPGGPGAPVPGTGTRRPPSWSGTPQSRTPARRCARWSCGTALRSSGTGSG